MNPVALIEFNVVCVLFWVVHCCTIFFNKPLKVYFKLGISLGLFFGLKQSFPEFANMLPPWLYAGCILVMLVVGFWLEVKEEKFGKIFFLTLLAIMALCSICQASGVETVLGINVLYPLLIVLPVFTGYFIFVKDKCKQCIN